MRPERARHSNVTTIYIEKGSSRATFHKPGVAYWSLASKEITGGPSPSENLAKAVNVVVGI